MKSSYTKYGTIAAGLLIAAIFLFPSKDIAPASVAWADVQKKMQEYTSAFVSGTRVCTYNNDENETYTFRVEKFVSKEFGYVEKMFLKDQLCFEFYVHRPSQSITVISHHRKQYFQFQATKDFLSLFDIVSIQGAMDYYCSGDIEKVGPEEIQGKEVIGFVRKDIDPFFTHKIDSKIINFLVPIKSTRLCMWVDSKTSLPVFGEHELEFGKGWVTGFQEMHLREFLDHIDWDAEIDEAIFLPEIPEGYELFGMPEMKTSAVIGVSGTAAAIPFFIWIKKRRKSRKIQ